MAAMYLRPGAPSTWYDSVAARHTGERVKRRARPDVRRTRDRTRAGHEIAATVAGPFDSPSPRRSLRAGECLRGRSLTAGPFDVASFSVALARGKPTFDSRCPMRSGQAQRWPSTSDPRRRQHGRACHHGHDDLTRSSSLSPAVCANCGEALEGEFCHSCGERQTGSDWLSVAPFIRQVGNELVNLDFKSVHTVAALLRPGHLTAQYLAGRRRVYLGPVKIYFLCAALYLPRGAVRGRVQPRRVDAAGPPTGCSARWFSAGSPRRIWTSRASRSGSTFGCRPSTR